MSKNMVKRVDDEPKSHLDMRESRIDVHALGVHIETNLEGDGIKASF